MDKAAILIDGGYFLKRLRTVRPDIDESDPNKVAVSLRQLVNGHLRQLNEMYKLPHYRQLLYRCFFYDALPFSKKAHLPISKKPIDYQNSQEANFRNGLFELLRREPSFALRLGEVTRPGEASWILKSQIQKHLLSKKIGIDDLDDKDFTANLRQKGVDMRIGLDIATITLKKQANIIVLVSGDSDFVPAARLARREGVTFILDPLWRSVSADLSEHIDQLRSGFYNPKGSSANTQGDIPASPETEI